MVERYIEVTDEYVKQLEQEIDNLKKINEKHKKLNCYVVNIPKEVVEKTNLKDADLKISSKDNKIIIEKWEKGE